MPSILPGYQYDIFISYRQNDNRSGWVSEFVKGLQEELASVIKYSVSVYFDSNPHDGLLETHSVDKTLEGKLKCLIFIPVISQTYCDPTSFAWNNEFLAFRNLARNDQYKLNIRLSNGNMASRILPIRIHELDPADQALFEKESGGVLRAVDFIFRSPGVNRPLRSKDDDVKEITHSLFYRDQINKVANAIRDLLVGLKTPATGSEVGEKSSRYYRINGTEAGRSSSLGINESESGQKSSQSSNIPAMPSKRNRLIIVAVVFSVLAVAVYFLSTDVISLTLLLIIGPVLYYSMMPSKRVSTAFRKLVIGVVGSALLFILFSQVKITKPEFLDIFKNNVLTAVIGTILLIIGLALNYFKRRK